jgi:5-methylcytosine-specific restriction endonuclease McrA
LDLQDWRQIAKDDLAALYRENSILEIAKLYGVEDESVRKKLIKFGIKRRPRGPSREFHIDRDTLHALYQEKSMKQIARMHNVGETVVWNRLKEFGITLKDFEDGGHRKKPGRVFSPEHRERMSEARTGKRAGENSPRWKGGATWENIKLRATGAYKRWKRDALALRGSKCQACGVADRTVCECCGTQVRLHVHHVKSFAAHPECRFDPENSEVLCPKCHHSRHHGKTG